MKNFHIEDIKGFMNEFLIQEKYDSFYLYEARIKTALDYYINGRVNPEFFDNSEEMNEFIGDMDKTVQSQVQQYVCWGKVKHTVYELIRGTRLPISFKVVLMFNRENIVRLVEMNNLPVRTEDVSSLAINVYYENGVLSVTTGTSLKIFTLDKTLEHLWDETVEKYYI